MLLSGIESYGWLDSQRRGLRGLLGHLPVALIWLAGAMALLYALLRYTLGFLLFSDKEWLLVARLIALVAIGLYETLNFKRTQIQNYPPSRMADYWIAKYWRW